MFGVWELWLTAPGATTGLMHRSQQCFYSISELSAVLAESSRCRRIRAIRESIEVVFEEAAVRLVCYPEPDCVSLIRAM
jgi:hypothetical protein